MTQCWTSGTTHYPRTTVTIADERKAVLRPARAYRSWSRYLELGQLGWWLLVGILVVHTWVNSLQTEGIRLLTERLDVYAVMRANDATRLRTVEEALWQVLQETRTPLRLPRGETPL